MPRVTWNVSPEQLALEEELRSRYGGMMTATDVQRELSFAHHKPTEDWLRDVPYTEVNNRKRWRVRFVAEKIYKNTHTEVGFA